MEGAKMSECYFSLLDSLPQCYLTVYLKDRHKADTDTNKIKKSMNE